MVPAAIYAQTYDSAKTKGQPFEQGASKPGALRLRRLGSKGDRNRARMAKPRTASIATFKTRGLVPGWACQCTVRGTSDKLP